VFSIVSARGLWTIARHVPVRIVNVAGTPDSEAIAGALSTFAATIAGVFLFRLLRSGDEGVRQRAILAMVAAAGVSSIAALLQAAGWLRRPGTDFWSRLGRHPGLAGDPNGLGILLAVSAVFPLAALAGPARRWRHAVFLALLVAGLAVSGSRSGFVLLGAAAVVGVLKRPAARRGYSLAALAVPVIVVLAILLAVGGPGSIAHRTIELFHPEIPIEQRASARPLFWSAAIRVFAFHPVAGIGWNAFSWNLPTLVSTPGHLVGVCDNPGNFYLQALAETGVAGGALFLLFTALAVLAVRRTLPSGAPLLRASALATSGFFVSLLFGSHLVALEGAVALFACLSALEIPEEPRWRAAPAILAGIAIAGWVASLPAIGGADYAFRFSRAVGFYPLERGPAGPFRWSARHAAVRLAPGERFELRAEFVHPARRFETLTISAEGATLYRSRLTVGIPVILMLEAPASRPAVMLWNNGASFRPSFYSRVEDDRDLSLQVSVPGP
jgi:O-antigen ligase